MFLGIRSKADALASCSMVAIGVALVVSIRLRTPAKPPEPARPVLEETAFVAGRLETPHPAHDSRVSSVAPGEVRKMEDRPAEVMAYIDHLADRELAAKLTEEFVSAVAGMHYNLLLSWLSRQEDEKIAALIFRGLIPRLIRENPDECISMGFALGEGKEAWGARDEMFFQLPFEQRMLLVDRLDEEERAWLLSRRATGFGERAPDLCLELIGDLPPSVNRSEALSKLMKAWVGGGNVYHLADPVSAAKSVMDIEDVDFRRDAFRQLSFEWGSEFTGIASRWLSGLASGPDRDAAVEGFVKSIAARDGATAAEWAATIEDEIVRTKVTQHLDLLLIGKKGTKK